MRNITNKEISKALKEDKNFFAHCLSAQKALFDTFESIDKRESGAKALRQKQVLTIEAFAFIILQWQESQKRMCKVCGRMITEDEDCCDETDHYRDLEDDLYDDLEDELNDYLN